MLILNHLVYNNNISSIYGYAFMRYTMFQEIFALLQFPNYILFHNMQCVFYDVNTSQQ